jgi:hypothetical protein
MSSPPSGPPRQGGYDRVGVPDGNGKLKVMTRAQFEDLPLGERVKLLMGGHLEFFRGDQKVAAREALRGA